MLLSSNVSSVHFKIIINLFSLVRFPLSIIGSVVIIDCVILIAVGKVNFGTVVPFLLGLVFIAHGIFWHKIIAFIYQYRWLSYLWYVLWTVFFIWLISFGVFIYVLQQQIKQNAKPIPAVAAIIVLGSGTVTPTLAKRLDNAAPLIHSQKNAMAITSGGMGFGQVHSEANIMARYLHNTYDIPLERIVQ